jgi:signal peptidase II
MAPPDVIESASKPPRAGRCACAVTVFAVATVLLLALDLGVKAAAFDRVAGYPVSLERDETGALPPLPRHEPRIVVPNVLALHLTVNRGAVFGLGQGGRWVFIGFSLIATVVIVVVFSRSAPDARVMHIALAAVLSGAIGNLYDRVCFGVVRDMLLLFPGVDLPFGWRWPDGSRGLYPWIFNVADVALVVGLLVLMVLLYRHDRRMARLQAEEAHRSHHPRPSSSRP